MQLRDYQQQLKDDIYSQWDAGMRAVCAVSPTGSGKTVLMGSVALDKHHAFQPGCVIAHRVELVSQISMAMARFGIPHNIIAAKSTIAFCIAQHVKELGRKFHDPRGMITVAAVDTLNARHKTLTQWFADQRWWMIDECFVAGTLIDNTPIEMIREGDTVTAFDEETGHVVRRKVVRTFKNPMPDEMVQLEIGHHVVYVTRGHPFWTKRGWVCAGELTERDEVYADTLHSVRNVGGRNDRIAKVSLAENGDDILQPEVWVRASGRKPKTSRIETIYDDVFHLRGASGPRPKFNVPVRENGSGVLQSGVQSNLRVETIIGDNGGNESEIRIRSHDVEQPDATQGSPRQGVKNTQGNGSRTCGEGWEREATDRSGTQTPRDVQGHGVPNATRGDDGVGSRSGPYSLQDRLCEPRTENSDRGGRGESCPARSSTGGSEEGRFLAWQRVGSVSVLKSDDPRIPGDGFVYNIEVEGVHTYVANGIVVHNCHHLLSGNKWGTAVSRMPQAIGLGVTATPVRADRKSLHVEQGGVFDSMVLGPTMRDLIDRGKLCDYRIFAPPQSYEMTEEDIGSTGDFKAKNAKLKAEKSEIVGDVVKHYLRLTPGKRGITFTVDVEEAESVAAAFNEAGVPAIAVSAKTPDSVRQAAIDKFRRGVVLQLVNVDLFGEGFDVPAVEVVSMARPTMSYGLYVQQFGRALRILEGKTHGIIIDHVGNVKRHGLPDAPRNWTLWAEGRGKKRDEEGKPIPVTACTQCFTAYERIHKACPYCGHVETPEGGGRTVERVDGDLVELSPDVLAAMRADVEKIDGEPLIPHGATAAIEGAVRKRWRERQESQGALRDTIARWAGVHRERGDEDSVIMRRFYFKFGVDILSAQSLGRKEAESLTSRITSDNFE